MGQVPNQKILVVGGGRMASHWNFYLRSLNFDVTQWKRQHGPFPKELPFNYIFLAISDDAISDFYSKYLTNYQGSVLHFSGSLFHKNILGCHPLSTFGPELYDFEFYKDLPLTFDGTRDKAFWSNFPNPQYKVRPDKKALYHSLCVLSANLPQLLWKECQTQMKTLGLPDQAIHNLISQSLENFKSTPETCLTGPLPRCDQKTIQRGLVALNGNKLKPLFHEAIQLAAKTKGSNNSIVLNAEVLDLNLDEGSTTNSSSNSPTFKERV